MTKIFIALPAFGMQVNAQTTTMLFALVQQLTLRHIPASIAALTFPDIADLRNVFATVFYDCLDATHLLFVDADMQAEPELVFDMLYSDQPVVGCIYPKKRLPISWVGSALEPPAEPKDGLLEMEGVGGGVLLIRRDAIKNMLDKGVVEVEENPQGVAGEMVKAHGATRMLHLFDKVKVEGRGTFSEDFAFCHRHRQAGGKIYAVVNHAVTHLGLYQFCGLYGDMYKAVGDSNDAIKLHRRIEDHPEVREG